MKHSLKITHLATEAKKEIRHGLLYSILGLIYIGLSFLLPYINPEISHNDSILLYLVSLIVVAMGIAILLYGNYLNKMVIKGYSYRVRTIIFVENGQEKELL